MCLTCHEDNVLKFFSNIVGVTTFSFLHANTPNLHHMIAMCPYCSIGRSVYPRGRFFAETDVWKCRKITCWAPCEATPPRLWMLSHHITILCESPVSGGCNTLVGYSVCSYDQYFFFCQKWPLKMPPPTFSRVFLAQNKWSQIPDLVGCARGQGWSCAFRPPVRYINWFIRLQWWLVVWFG